MPGRRYDLSLEFQTSTIDYRGRVTVHEAGPVTNLELDAEGLSIESVRVDGALAPFSVDAPAGRVRIGPLAPPTDTVTVDFSGRAATDQAYGLYRSSLGDSEALTTQFETCGARRMFPCQDRPDAKAVFALEVIAPRDRVVISNMPSERFEEMDDRRRRTRFAPTPVMSTYLLYVGVGPFEEVERVAEGHRIIAATAPGVSARTRYMTEVAGRVLPFFEDYYRIRYPLPKLHLVGIPRFLSGAMENWGAIVAAEPFLLVDERTSLPDRQRLVTICAHEIAHQWFGNLVTMRTWDDLWLNEAFATFASYKAREALFPEWAGWEEFLSPEVADAMLYDSLPSTHPIHVEVTDPTRAEEFFDEISYNKGAAVLRMLEGYVGESVFREGVALYLREHQGGNAVATDLWAAIARVSKDPIDRVMSEWILRPGFPILRVRLEGNSLRLDQRRFSMLGPSTDEQPWPIPLTVLMGGHRRHRLMEEWSLALPATSDGPIVVGPGRTGFYRVRYEGPLWERLLLSYADLDPMDRWGILNDTRSFFLSGEVELPQYLEVLGRAASDSHPLVATEAYDSFCWLSPLAWQIPALKEAFRAIFVAQTERLGFAPRAGEPPSAARLRDRAHRARVALDPDFARSLAESYPKVESVTPELAEAVFMAYGASAGPVEYAVLRKRFRDAPPGMTGRQIAGGLGLLNREEWLLECLDMLGTGEMELSSWTHLAQTAVELNPGRYDALWSFLTERLDRLLPALSEGTSALSRVLQYGIPAVGLTRPEEMRSWLDAHPFSKAGEGEKKGRDMLAVLARALDRSRPATSP